MMPRKRWKVFFNGAKECLEQKFKAFPLYQLAGDVSRNRAYGIIKIWGSQVKEGT
jgi:hypothetical protein